MLCKYDLFAQANLTTDQLLELGVTQEKARMYAGDRLKLLHMACTKGDLEVMRILGKDDLNAKDTVQ